jgi:mannose-1-phosphate guanylyltransferase / mannose-6-phosphate isomerase
MRMSDGQSLLQKAFLRGVSLPDVAQVMTVSGRDLLFNTKDDYDAVNSAGISTAFVLEPFGRDTAAAVAAAALRVQATHGDAALMLVLAADHLIADVSAFQDAVQRACQLAATGRLVTFGIQPQGPETGYGYIEAEGNTVLRFVEKPNLETAKDYVASGRFLWNSGMFCFTAGTVLAEMARLCPDILDATRACLLASIDTQGRGKRGAVSQVELDAESFAQVRRESIDFAVMEKSNIVSVVPCDIGWSDIGSWAAISELTPPDAQGNRVQGEALLHDTHNCYVQSDGRLVGTVGLNGLIIIDTPDALLVADIARSQEVKHIFNRLKAQGHESHKIHRTVHRPWGTYTVLEEDTRFKIKRIEVSPGASLSLQMHHHRSEHWIVVSGTAVVVNGDQELMLRTNESTYIPAGHKHRLRNPGLLPLVMIEVQSGEYLGEDDIVRYDDHYGRA